MQNTHPSQTPPSSSTSVLSDGFLHIFFFFIFLSFFFSFIFFSLVAGVSLGMFAEHFFGSILSFAIGSGKALVGCAGFSPVLSC